MTSFMLKLKAIVHRNMRAELDARKATDEYSAILKKYMILAADSDKCIVRLAWPGFLPQPILDLLIAECGVQTKTGAESINPVVGKSYEFIDFFGWREYCAEKMLYLRECDLTEERVSNEQRRFDERKGHGRRTGLLRWLGQFVNK